LCLIVKHQQGGGLGSSYAVEPHKYSLYQCRIELILSNVRKNSYFQIVIDLGFKFAAAKKK